MPSRLVRSWPGCAISAGTERSTMPPTARRSSVTKRGAGAAVRRIHLDRIGQQLQRQAGGLGGLLGEDHGAGAGVERHGDSRAVDLRRHLEIAGAPAHDLHRSLAAQCGAAGHQLGHHALADAAQLAAIGVDEHQHEADHDPEQRRFERCRKAFSEQHQHCAADEHHKRQVVGQRAPVIGRKAGDRVLAVARDDDDERERNPDQQHPEQTAAHGDHPGWLEAARALMASSRCGSSFMTRARSPSL